mgnify:CR=1 FL=1
MYPSNCPCVGWVASRHSVSLYILLNLFFRWAAVERYSSHRISLCVDVEVDVGFDTGLQCPGSCGRSPLREVLFEDCGVVCRSPFGGFFGDRDFQYFPHFVQVVQVGAPEAPLHRFVRGREAFDKCPGTLPYLQEPHVGQDSDRFAHGRAADPENLHQLRFGR